ncbi:hypothetical protein ACFL08_02820 [Patescibacteria group bacterium]
MMFTNKKKAFRRNLGEFTKKRFNEVIDEIFDVIIEMINESDRVGSKTGMIKLLCEATGKGKVSDWPEKDKAEFFDFFEKQFALLGQSGNEDPISNINIYSKYYTELSDLVEKANAYDVDSAELHENLKPAYDKLTELESVARDLRMLSITIREEYDGNISKIFEDESGIDISKDDLVEDGEELNLSDLDIPINEDPEDESVGDDSGSIGDINIYSAKRSVDDREQWKNSDTGDEIPIK